jgi:hypothetical protein
MADDGITSVAAAVMCSLVIGCLYREHASQLTLATKVYQVASEHRSVSILLFALSTAKNTLVMKQATDPHELIETETARKGFILIYQLCQPTHPRLQLGLLFDQRNPRDLFQLFHRQISLPQNDFDRLHAHLPPSPQVPSNIVQEHHILHPQILSTPSLLSHELRDTPQSVKVDVLSRLTQTNMRRRDKNVKQALELCVLLALRCRHIVENVARRENGGIAHRS